MESPIGMLFVIAAGFMQGSFILPMTLVKNWRWEHTWLVFSAFGMVVLNLLLALIFLEDFHLIYREVPAGSLAMLTLFGLGWGIGAVLFGIGMDKLGMSLGYPIIMGLIASIGGLLPMFILHSGSILKPSGLLMMAGTLVVVGGIYLCSRAAETKAGPEVSAGAGSALTQGILIAVFAGILSSLPNIGFSFGTAITERALQLGTSERMAGNAVWALFFSAGFVPNLGYTAWLLLKNRGSGASFAAFPVRNFSLGLLMALLWIGSFYLYGVGSVELGQWGSVVGWPVFISISIVVGNLWGLWKGEWSDAHPSARRLLNAGMLVLIVAMILTGLSGRF